jgi:hypothetical protein
MLSRVWDLWVQEEECAGRTSPEVVGGKPFSKLEKRFASSFLSELIPDIPTDVLQTLVRISLVGGKRVKKSIDEDDNLFTVISLPATVYIYRRNELLKCKLAEIKGLSSQTIFVNSKEWGESASPSSANGEVEFSSFDSLFESYQQKFVRKQDRLVLPSPLEAWKYFAVKPTGQQDYLILYDLAQKATSAAHYAFTDKGGNPIFIPSVAAARSADIEKRKKQNDMKDERKRKREALEAKAKEVSKRNPPFNDSFLPIPEFSKELFLQSTRSASLAPEIRPESPPPDQTNENRHGGSPENDMQDT